MYDTRPSKDNLELLMRGLESSMRSAAELTEAEKAAESIVIGFMSRPEWSLRSDDTHISIGEYAKNELREEIGLDESQWKEGVSVLLRDKVLVLDRTDDRKQFLPRNLVRVEFPSVERDIPAYLLTVRVLEYALKTLRPKE